MAAAPLAIKTNKLQSKIAMGASCPVPSVDLGQAHAKHSKLQFHLTHTAV